MDTTVKSSHRLARIGAPFVRVWLTRAAYAAALAVALLIVEALVSHLFGTGQENTRYWQTFNERPEAVFVYCSALFVAPLVETLVMAWLVLLMMERMRRTFVVVLSGLLWAAIHMVGNPVGWVMFISFAAYSYLFMIRREGPRNDGFSLVVMAHFFHNLIVLTMATGAGLITWHL